MFVMGHVLLSADKLLQNSMETRSLNSIGIYCWDAVPKCKKKKLHILTNNKIILFVDSKDL
jgi:hypothetical protein